jgi:hypothetical protein
MACLRKWPLLAAFGLCSGWLLETKGSEKRLERLDVTDGLWAFYVDKSSRRHGSSTSSVCLTMAQRLSHYSTVVMYEPMQLFYCDKRVTTPGGGNSYRVQGTQQGWVLDKRNDTQFMLLPESSVRSGLFAFQVLQHVSIWSKPDAFDESRTLRPVIPGKTVPVLAKESFNNEK